MTPLSLYIHWPFCLAKCPYCDFNSHVAEVADQGPWRVALLAEMGRYAELIGPRTLTSIFFGGGTPSLMTPQTVAAVIEAATGHWAAASDLEITIEANPGAVEAGRFSGFRDAGVNRLSLGVQSLNETDLKALGRIHSLSEALIAVDLAMNTFERVNLDFIYARPEQTVQAWREELRQVLSLGAEHISLYQLTYEPGTVFGTKARQGQMAPPEEDLALALFDLTREETDKAGLPAYEISNHAKPGAECRHNLDIWRGQDYVGIGPGAHGRVGGQATVQSRNPETWFERPEESSLALSDMERAEELVMLGLRLTDGIDRATFKTACGLDLDRVVGLDSLIEDGFLFSDQQGLRLTPAGVPLLDPIVEKLLLEGAQAR